MEGETLSGAHRLEGRRRAAILRRYVAIENPDQAADEAFAAELGLSVDSLIRLATAWRRHGDAARLAGARAQTTPEDREAALERLRGPIDLSGVSRPRRTETLRRLDVVRRFLEIESPTSADREGLAAEVGVSSARFMALVRAWILRRDPRDVPGAVIPRRVHRKAAGRRNAVTEIVREAMERLGEDALGSEVHAYVAAECGIRGLKAPSLPTIYLRMRELRAFGGLESEAGSDRA